MILGLQLVICTAHSIQMPTGVSVVQDRKKALMPLNIGVMSRGLPRNKKEARALRQRKKLSAVTKANQVII